MSDRVASSTPLEQGIARVIELHEESMAQQGQQSKVLQSQLQGLMAGQNNLRSMMLEQNQLLERQHQQLLQRLFVISHGSSQRPAGAPVETICDIDQKQVPALLSVFPEPDEEANGKDASQKVGKEANGSQAVHAQRSTSSVGEAKRKKGGGALSRSTGEPGVHLNVSNLPQSWAFVEEGVTERATKSPWLRRAQRIVRSSAFDAFCTLFVLGNLVAICVQLQLRSYYSGVLLGVRDDDDDWAGAQKRFQQLEIVFTSVFAVEAVVRVSILGWEFLRVGANMFDTFVVVITCFQIYLLQPLGVMKDASFVALARLIRLVRVMRLMKVVRFAEWCAELRILVRAFVSSVSSLLWSMVVVGFLIVIASIVLYQMALSYIEDDANPMPLRLWCWENFGTYWLTMMALFESTFTGSWHRYTQKMLVEMNPLYALFWVPYVVVINFAVMRLTGALFLKETMAVAAIDQERVAANRLKKHRNQTEKVREIFMEADSSGDGKVDATEFEAMLYNEHVGRCFAALELEVSEVAVLFELLASDSGEANYHDFLEGLLKLKQSAQTIDIIQLMHGNHTLGLALQTLYGGLCDLASVNGVILAKTALDGALGQSDAAHLFTHGRASEPGGGGDDADGGDNADAGDTNDDAEINAAMD